ncbi:hypothetical protein [Cohnella algarum]|uniref:hypothetical protein n=1 Tax=Cohnella algarum TaxID=2044859 RepID=UPI001966FBBA|nr:hypothetical protein [Cohnella algarum]MBN2980141.1 hypothetical protein [Cohnella algarum]
MTTHVISLGAGVQSTTLFLMAGHGEIGPKPDFAVFADTGWEPRKVYQHLKWLKGKADEFGIPIIETSKGNIRDDLLAAVEGDIKFKDTVRFANIPFFVKNADGTVSMMKRQCTKEYKIEQIVKEIRAQLGYKPRQRVKEQITEWIGISTDEIQRIKPSRTPWITHRWPLIEIGMSRVGCVSWLTRHGYPIPPKSSCIGCPYHDDRLWLEIKRNDLEAWEEAVFIDYEIRKLKRFRGQVFLHRSCVPLDQVDLQEDQMDWFDDGFLNECEGMCGV